MEEETSLQKTGRDSTYKKEARSMEVWIKKGDIQRDWESEQDRDKSNYNERVWNQVWI